EQHQLIGQRRAADKGYVRIDHARKPVAGPLDEFGGGAVGRDHDDGPDLYLLGLQLVDRVVDLHRVALVVETQDGGVVDAERAECLGDAGEARVTIGVLLGEHGDLARLQPADLDQIVYGRGGLFRIAGAVIED